MVEGLLNDVQYTGFNSVNTAGLGFGIIAIGIAAIKQRRKLGKREM